MEIIILSGGLGTRLSKVVSNVPKPMAPIHGKPFLEYVFEDMFKQGVNKVILATGYKKEYIKDYFGEQYKNILIDYSEEETPMGTGGALKKALSKTTEEDIILIYGDIYTKIDYNKLYQCHKNSNDDITLTIKEMENFDRFESVTLKDNKIISFEEKKFVSRGYMNVGCYVFKRDIFKIIENNLNFSFENNFLPQKVKYTPFNPYIYEGIFIDIGIPEDYELIKTVIKP